MTTLYRAFAEDGTLLYVGIAGDPGRRFNEHALLSAWWTEAARLTLAHYPSRASAMSAELAAIRAERPVYNVIGAAVSAPRARESALDDFFDARGWAESGSEERFDLLPEYRLWMDYAASVGYEGPGVTTTAFAAFLRRRGATVRRRQGQSVFYGLSRDA